MSLMSVSTSLMLNESVPPICVIVEYNVNIVYLPSTSNCLLVLSIVLLSTNYQPISLCIRPSLPSVPCSSPSIPILLVCSLLSPLLPSSSSSLSTHSPSLSLFP